MSSLQINNQSPLRRSSRIATIIPASYWTSIGYSEAGGQARVNLQLDMKRYCDGSDDEFTIIKLIPKDSEGEIYLRNCKLSHNDLMLPHWQKFGTCLSGRNTVKDVYLCGVELPVSVLDIILPSFQSMNLSSLTLYRTGLRNEGFRRLSSYLKKNTSIKELCFFGDTIDDISVATSFSDAVKNHPALEQIGITGIRGLKNNIILRKVLEGCSRVRALHLIRNAFGSEDAAVLADFISSNHPTELLNLQHNKVSDNDTLLLASALKKNTHLKWLNLQNNNITKVGEKNLLSALFDPTSMDSITKSNHTCLPYTYDIHNKSMQSKRMSGYEWELYEIHLNRLPMKQTIRRKVILALSLCKARQVEGRLFFTGELFTLSYFNELPLGIMPRVLAFIQEHTEFRKMKSTPVQLERDALSRLFHTLRRWELPLLFENLGSSSAKRATRKKRKRRNTR